MHMWTDIVDYPFGCGSKLHQAGTADFGPCFHLPGFHIGTVFLTHIHLGRSRAIFLRLNNTLRFKPAKHGWVDITTTVYRSGLSSSKLGPLEPFLFQLGQADP